MKLLMTWQSHCPWCDTYNRPFEHWCRVCSHAAHLAKEQCDCAACVAEKILPAALAALAERQPERAGEQASFPE